MSNDKQRSTEQETRDRQGVQAADPSEGREENPGAPAQNSEADVKVDGGTRDAAAK